MLSFSFNPFPDLHTPRLLLRRMLPSDGEVLFRLRNADAVMQYIDRPRQKDLEEILAFIAMVDEKIDAHTDINWAIALKTAPDVMIGTIGYYRNNPEHHWGEVGYMLDPAWWRQGIMLEALREVLRYGFQTMGFHRVKAGINPENEASRGLLLKVGFRKEAYFREDHLSNGVFGDSEEYGLLDREFLQARGLGH
jgi:ribosomal-protein-alanine N-acetyltransferase